MNQVELYAGLAQVYQRLSELEDLVVELARDPDPNKSLVWEGLSDLKRRYGIETPDV